MIAQSVPTSTQRRILDDIVPKLPRYLADPCVCSVILPLHL